MDSINSNNNIEDEDDQINSEDQEIMTNEELIGKRKFLEISLV